MRCLTTFYWSLSRRASSALHRTSCWTCKLRCCLVGHDRVIDACTRIVTLLCRAAASTYLSGVLRRLSRRLWKTAVVSYRSWDWSNVVLRYLILLILLWTRWVSFYTDFVRVSRRLAHLCPNLLFTDWLSRSPVLNLNWWLHDLNLSSSALIELRLALGFNRNHSRWWLWCRRPLAGLSLQSSLFD